MALPYVTNNINDSDVYANISVMYLPRDIIEHILSYTSNKWNIDTDMDIVVDKKIDVDPLDVVMSKRCLEYLQASSWHYERHMRVYHTLFRHQHNIAGMSLHPDVQFIIDLIAQNKQPSRRQLDQRGLDYKYLEWNMIDIVQGDFIIIDNSVVRDLAIEHDADNYAFMYPFTSKMLRPESKLRTTVSPMNDDCDWSTWFLLGFCYLMGALMSARSVLHLIDNIMSYF